MVDPMKSTGATAVDVKARNRPWFIAEGHKGFTENPDYAMRDIKGNPVLAPGEVNRVWNAEYARISRRRDRLWTKLLDLMEEDLDMADRQNDAVESGDVLVARSVKRDRLTNRGIQMGIKIALAELELPENRASGMEEDIKWVEKRAQSKYDEESD